MRCARCSNVWRAVAPIMVQALATLDDLDVIDTGPKVPAFDGLPRRAEDAKAPALADPASKWGQDEAVPEEAPEAELAPPPAEPTPEETVREEPQPETVSTEGIDLAGLSAEIEAAQAEQEAAADAVLAEVAADDIAVTDSPSLVPPMEPSSPRETPPVAPRTDAGEDIQTFSAKRARRPTVHRRNSQWAVPGLPAIILALVAANAILVAWRMDIVRLLPQAASLYSAIGLPVNLRGISFQDIKMSKEEQDGMTVLVVEGSIVNTVSHAVDVPRLRLSVRNERKNEIYSWTTMPTRSILGPGETLPFRSRLASPPAETRDVLVRFFNKRDMVAGLR